MRRLLERITERHILLLCLLSFVARCAFLLVVQPPIPTAESFNIAQNLVAGKGFSIYDRGPTTVKGPLYVGFLALPIALFGSRAGLIAAIVIQHALASALPWLLYRLGVQWGTPTLGKGAAVLFALHPSYFYHPTVAEDTTLTVFLEVFWCVVLFDLESRRRAPLIALGLGAILGTFVLDKPVAVVPMLATAAVLLWRQKALLTALAAGAAAVVLAWAVRGYVTFGELTPTKSYSAYQTFIHSWLPGMAVHPRYATSPEAWRRLDSLQRLPEQEALPGLRRMALELLRERWWQLPERTLVHAAIFWSIPPRYWSRLSATFILGRVVPVAVLLVLTVVGAVHLGRTHRHLVLGIIAVLAWWTLFYSLYHVLNIRFKLEIEWLQLFLAAAAVGRWCGKTDLAAAHSAE